MNQLSKNANLQTHIYLHLTLVAALNVTLQFNLKMMMKLSFSLWNAKTSLHPDYPPVDAQIQATCAHHPVRPSDGLVPDPVAACWRSTQLLLPRNGVHHSHSLSESTGTNLYLFLGNRKTLDHKRRIWPRGFRKRLNLMKHRLKHYIYCQIFGYLMFQRNIKRANFKASQGCARSDRKNPRLTAQACSLSHENVWVWTSWWCRLSKITRFSVLILCRAGFSELVCVFPCRGELTPLLATIPPVTEPSVGTASSFHQGSFYDQRTYYYRNSITSCDWAHCWSPQPVKAPNKTARPPGALFDMAHRPGCCWEMRSQWESSACSPCCRKAELIVSLTHRMLTRPL